MKIPLNTSKTAVMAITPGLRRSQAAAQALEHTNTQASSSHVVLNEQGRRQRILDVARSRVGITPDAGRTDGKRTAGRCFSTSHTKEPDKKTDVSISGATSPPPPQCPHTSSDAIYAVGPLPDEPNARRDYLHHPENWMPERRGLHQSLLAGAVRNALRFAEAVVDSGGSAAVYALRGNTAAGKTSTVRKTMPMLAKALDRCGNGAVNPDIFKPHLRPYSNTRLSSRAVHVESSVLAGRLVEQLAPLKTANGAPASILVDQRLADVESVGKYVSLATKTSRDVLLSDIDAPLKKSLARVLARSPAGNHPIPPFNAISDGFAAVRANRAAVVDLFVTRPDLSQYQLIGTTPTGEQVKVATVEHGELTVEHPDLYARLTTAPGDVPDRIAREPIDERTIDAITSGLDPERGEHLRAALYKYLGKTWAQALDAHSQQV